MIELLTFMFLSISCPEVIKINKSNETWNNVDMMSYQRAKWVCQNDERYSDTPCLKYFIKKEPLIYHAICGGGE